MNNIDIHVNKTSSYCHIDLYDKASDKNISFYVNNTNLLSKDIKDTVFLQEDLLKAYELEDRAVIEATTYTNHLSLLVDAQDFTLVSEDVNRVAVFNGETPVTQVTAVKVIDEEGNELRSSMHIDEENNTIELYIENEEVSKATNKATAVIEFAPYVEFTSERAIYLRTFNELDYWYDLTNREIYTVDKYNNKELYVKLSTSHISISSYPYQVPTMISETVFFSKHKTCFFKIEKAGEKPTITKIKDETSFFGMTYLYDNVWVTAYKDTSTNSYQYQIIEFTDVETASYEILDSHVIEIGKSVNECFYFPYVIYNYDDKLAISFYSYQYNSYLPTTDQCVCAKIDKANKCFDFTDIEPMQHLTYEDDEYRLIFNWSDRKYYANGSILSGHYTYPAKPLTLREGNRLYGYTISYSDSSSEIAEFYLDNSKNMAYDTFLQRIWNNGSYAGTKSIDTKPVTDTWDVFKDTDIKKRSIRATTVDDYIIPEGVTSNLGSVKLNNNSIYLKKEVIQNKKFLSTVAYSTCQLLQRDKVIASAITVAENTDIEMRTYSSASVSFSNQYILTEEKDFNIYESLSDVHRVVENNIYDLQIDENATIIDKIDDKYDLNFAQWQYATESFEGDPLINFRGNATSAYIRDELASTGSKSLFMTAEYKAKEYIEFDTVSDSISFRYYISSYPFGTELNVYINGINKDSFYDDDSNKWRDFSYTLNPEEKSTIKLEYDKCYVLQSDRYNGCFIDDISCNLLADSTEATVYFNTYDLGMYDSSQAVSIKFNDLEISDNVTQAIYYSTDAGTTWEIFKGMLPNKDNISLKAVFTKPSIEEEAYVRFSSVTVMPGELDWVTNIDTNRKIYDTSDIVPELIENITVSKNEDNRYNLDFTPEVEAIETFDKDCKVIDYTLESGKYGTVELVNEGAYSGNKCLKYTWNDYYNVTMPSQGRMTFKTKATQLKLMAKLVPSPQTPLPTRLRGNIFIGINGGEYTYSVNQNLNDGFMEYTYNLNLTEESTISIGYTSPGSERSDILIDNITLVGETVTLNMDPYIETEVVDLSIFPSDITCELVTDDLQSSHDLNTQYFYTINDGQDWLEFDKTLPNSSNVRLKAVFTKDTEEEVIASFKNLIIRQDDGSTIKATIRLATTRTVHASNNKSYETSREVVNTSKTTILTQRQVFKDVDMALSTNRKTILNDNLALDTQRDVIKVNTIRRSLDTLREVHKSYINSLDSNRSLSKNDSRAVDTKLAITNAVGPTIDTKRVVWNVLEIDKKLDTIRTVYITSTSFVTQLNADFRLHKGTLFMTNQEFN